MHDPMTVAHEIKLPIKNKYGCNKSILTIWHVDPEKDGTDDSCGWFKRAHHGDKEVLAQIKKEFAFNFKHNYWFDEEGLPKYSVTSTVLLMYREALWQHFKRNRRKVNKFMAKHLYDIMIFAQNPFDSINDEVCNRWKSKDEERLNSFAAIIYGDILRKCQKWYQHPRWHIWHWRFQLRIFPKKVRQDTAIKNAS